MTHFATGFPHIELHDPVDFSSNMPKAGSPTTEPAEDPELAGRTVVRCVRKFFGERLSFAGNPDGTVNGVPLGQGPVEAEIWSFEDETSGRRLPAPLVRAREGDVVHVVVEPSKRVHTIHLHGIEPDPRNDGVGHTSYEVTGSYDYLFSPQRGRPGDPDVGTAGSYFYHCHVNTVLHVQMGMFGPLVIDPPTGPGKAFVDGPAYDVDTETFWATFAIDPRWHELGHAAGLAGEDVGLNRFDPNHFFLLGAELKGLGCSSTAGTGSFLGSSDDGSGSSGSSGSGSGSGPLLAPKLRAKRSGDPTLLRIVNGTYIPTRYRFPFDVEVIASDGRPFRDTSTPGAPSPPRSVKVPAGQVLIIGAAERYDLLLRPAIRGVFAGEIEFLDWITRQRRALVTPKIEVID